MFRRGPLLNFPPPPPPPSGGMVLVAYAGPVRPAAALRNSVLCLPTDTHFVPDAEGLLLQEGSSAGTDSQKFSF